MKTSPFTFLLFITLLSESFSQSVARQWNEENLNAIRIDFPAPTVHARNLFFLSGAMHDAWAAFDDNTQGYFHHESFSAPSGQSLSDARNEAISFAAYRVLSFFYGFSTSNSTSIASFTNKMANLGYSTSFTSQVGTSSAALGNRIAQTIINHSYTDGASQDTLPGYRDYTFSYSPVNTPLILTTNDTAGGYPSGWNDMNRWQPLAFAVAFTQNGQIASQTQTFVSPHWGNVTPFGLTSAEQDTDGLYFNPGAPPYLDGVGSQAYKDNAIEVLELSALLDPVQNNFINASPGARGNNTLGENDGTGHNINPHTDAPYALNIVNHADYGRVLAEFWADGPDSETPPGHWNVLANEVTDDLASSTGLNFQGSGDILDRLEWEVKLYLAMNAALHNTAVAVWGIKEHYDYVRPISAIRYLSKRGDLPLVPGLVELITSSTAATGGKHAHLSGHIGKIAVNVWPGEPSNIATQWGGRDWILGEEWLPYQRDTFVTPAFAGYVSGHSGFSRAAAEVMTLFTGDAFFPGGMKTHTVPAGGLHFEFAPSVSTSLQWATYYDAADEAGLSRLYGGIHVSPDDGPGRIVGSQIGINAFNHAKLLWENRIKACIDVDASNCTLTFQNCFPGLDYTLKSSTVLTNDFPTTEIPTTTATSSPLIITRPTNLNRCFYRLERVID